jgi:peptidoglycan/LPS O-acetylase OafA/YrhL
MRPHTDRLTLVDALKVFACQSIVLHHLAFYGPVSDAAASLAPGLASWLSQHGRLAVQVFLVAGGFLAARALAPDGRLVARKPLALIGRRYARLAVPYLGAVALAVAGAAVARALIDHPSIPAAPSFAQLLAHALMLQDVLGFESLSAGFWYVAVDLQLFALFVAALCLARRGARAPHWWQGPFLVVALGGASLFVFNRMPALDVWAPYFFAYYALGAIAYWTSRRARASLWLLPLVVVVLAALELDFRLRVAVALVVALMLAAGRLGVMPMAWAEGRRFATLARISYSVFLVHFSVCLVVNALWVRFVPERPWMSALGVLLAWAASVAIGALFYRFVESRSDAILGTIARLAGRRRDPSDRRAPQLARAPSGR